MEIIAHRINTIEELRKVPREYGVEVDLKGDLDGNIYMMHDPFKKGILFEDFLKEYHHGTLILDIKDERIEEKVLSILCHYDIPNFFFLDCSFPMIYKLTEVIKERNVAIRFSEYEGIETAVNMQGKAGWVWVDTFNKNPMSQYDWALLKSLGYRICFVSPELQGQPEKREEYLKYFEKTGVKLDAICTDFYREFK